MTKSVISPISYKAIFSVALLSTPFSMVQAQEGDVSLEDLIQLEEVIVTAEKREASLQDTPISIVALDSSALEDLNVTDLGDIDGMVPNLEMTPFPNQRSALVLFMRGIGNNENQITQDPAIGVYMDGIYVGRSSGLASDVADLERIEILRGPQGTLYGRNTTGGAINLVSAKPAEDFGFSQTVSVGNRDTWQSKSTIDTGEIGKFSARASYMLGAKGGFVENEGQGNDFGEDEKDAGRIALRMLATDDLTIDYAYDFSNIDGPQQFYQVTKVFPDIMAGSFAAQGVPAEQIPFIVGAYQAAESGERLESGSIPFPVEDSETEVFGHGLTFTLETDYGTFKSITGYRELEESVQQDYSGQPNIPTFNAQVTTEHDQLSQEFQLVGDAMDSRLNYVTGVYYYEEGGRETEFTSVVPTAWNPADPSSAVGATVIENRTINIDNTAAAIYGQFGYQFTDLIEVIVGARYTRDEREASKLFDYTGIDFNADGTQVAPETLNGSKTYSNFNPSLTVNLTWTDELSTYAKVVSAYKSGGFNLRSTKDGFDTPYNEENLISYEAGWKAQMLDNRVRFNGAIFHSLYEDMQTNQIPNNFRVSQTDVFNAGEAEITGFELDVTALLVRGLTLMGSYGYIDAEFTKVTDEVGDGGDITNQYTMPYSPESSYNVTLEYAFPEMAIGDMRAMLNYNWRDEQFGTASNADMDGFKIDSYGLWNARLSLENIDLGDAGMLRFSLWGKNLADEEYIAHQISFNTHRVGYYGEPRTYGFDLTYDF